MPHRRLVERATLPFAAIICLVIAYIAQAMPSQDPPPKTIRTPELRWDALTNVAIVTRPGERIEDGVILMRDGVVVAAGANLDVPGGYRVHDRTGYVAYPGLIEPALMSTPRSRRRRRQINAVPITTRRSFPESMSRS
jgi:hypothetical protein